MFWAAALVSMTAPAPIAAPADHWNVAVDLGKCRLERSYTEPSPAALSIESTPGSGSYFLELALPRNSRIGPGMFFDADIKVDGARTAKAYIDIGQAKGPLNQVFSVLLEPETIDTMSKGSQFAIGLGRINVSVPLPDIGKALGALHNCEAEQLVEWGADPAQFKPGGTPPKVGDRNKFISQETMGRMHLPKGPIEPLHYVVLSDTGIVEHCEAVYGIPGGDMEQVTCATMMGRKLGEPARDPAGKAVRSVVTFSPAFIRRTTIQVSQ